jgi:hypothetical protein
MNLTFGGKNKKPQNDIYFLPECSFSKLQGQVQLLYNTLPNGTRQPKGVKQIFQERGCYVKGIKLKCGPRCPEPTTYPVTLLLSKSPCCLARILLNHKDFYKQKSAIKTLVKGRGHKCLLIPKFHHKLNPIKMY